MESYADSSFLVSVFVDDGNHGAAHRFVLHYPGSLPFNPWHRLEVRNAIRLSVKRGRMDVDYRRRAFAQIHAAFASGFLIHQSIDWTNFWRRADELSARHTETLGSRAADILHVAIALEDGAKRFFSFDANQRRLAAAEGLEVLP